MCNVLPGRLPGERMDPAPSFNWSHILGLKHSEIERECARDKNKMANMVGRGLVPVASPDCFYKRNVLGVRS